MDWSLLVGRGLMVVLLLAVGRLVFLNGCRKGWYDREKAEEAE